MRVGFITDDGWGFAVTSGEDSGIEVGVVGWEVAWAVEIGNGRGDGVNIVSGDGFAVVSGVGWGGGFVNTYGDGWDDKGAVVCGADSPVGVVTAGDGWVDGIASSDSWGDGVAVTAFDGV